MPYSQSITIAFDSKSLYDLIGLGALNNLMFPPGVSSSGYTNYTLVSLGSFSQVSGTRVSMSLAFSYSPGGGTEWAEQIAKDVADFILENEGRVIVVASNPVVSEKSALMQVLYAAICALP
jgi:hypothetical protein